MLSAVLRSSVAIDVSVKIMKTFVEMRRFIASNAAMFEQIRAVELRQLEYQKSTDERFERVFDYMEAHEAPKQKVFFEGKSTMLSNCWFRLSRKQSEKSSSLMVMLTQARSTSLPRRPRRLSLLFGHTPEQDLRSWT